MPVGMLAFSLVAHPVHLPDPAHAAVAAAQSAGIRATWAPDLAFNTAVSFTTNTNWQDYTPETTMSYFMQMVGLAMHNFFSAAAGIAVGHRLRARLRAPSVKTLGNFWVDLTRATLYVLLPLSIVGALVLCSQGVIQNFIRTPRSTTLEGATQTIPQGPVASQEAIKMLGTNGGGFFNANSAHPFENPTPFSNFLQMLLIFLIPAGLTYTFGKMVRDTRQGWALFAAMSVLFLAGVFVAYHVEQAGNPILTKLGIETRPTGTQPAATWKARRCASASPTPRCSRSSPPTRAAAPSTTCTTASRRSAAWCRCSTSSWAK